MQRADTGCQLLGPALIDLICGSVITEPIWHPRHRHFVGAPSSATTDDHGTTLVYATLTFCE
jgi:hypothetical protein